MIDFNDTFSSSGLFFFFEKNNIIVQWNKDRQTEMQYFLFLRSEREKKREKYLQYINQETKTTND